MSNKKLFIYGSIILLSFTLGGPFLALLALLAIIYYHKKYVGQTNETSTYGYGDKPYKDERKAECPSCHKELKKIPGAKTKCPHCGEYMYVRTNTENIRLVITKSEADKIDEKWRIESGTQEAYLAEQKKVSARRDALKKKFNGKEPSENDVQWSLLNEEIIEHSSNAQWGLYSNTRRQMAEILWKEKRLKDALLMYCMVCYLDLNGASNVITDENGKAIRDPEFFRPFDVETKFLAPAIIKRMQKIIKELEITKEDFSELFIERATIEHRATKAPVPPKETLKELLGEIFE